MKKRNVKSLKLNKKSISNLDNIVGGCPNNYVVTVSDPYAYCCPLIVSGRCDTFDTSLICDPTMPTVTSATTDRLLTCNHG